MSRSISDFHWFSCDKTRVVVRQHYTQACLCGFLNIFWLIHYFSSSGTWLEVNLLSDYTDKTPQCFVGILFIVVSHPSPHKVHLENRISLQIPFSHGIQKTWRMYRFVSSWWPLLAVRKAMLYGGCFHFPQTHWILWLFNGMCNFRGNRVRKIPAFPGIPFYWGKHTAPSWPSCKYHVFQCNFSSFLFKACGSRSHPDRSEQWSSTKRIRRI